MNKLFKLSIASCCFFIAGYINAQTQDSEDQVINTALLAQKAPNKADVELTGKIIEKSKGVYVFKDSTGEVNLEIPEAKKIVIPPTDATVKVTGRIKTNYLRYINNKYFTTTIKVRKITIVPDNPAGSVKADEKDKQGTK